MGREVNTRKKNYRTEDTSLRSGDARSWRLRARSRWSSGREEPSPAVLLSVMTSYTPFVIHPMMKPPPPSTSACMVPPRGYEVGKEMSFLKGRIDFIVTPTSQHFHLIWKSVRLGGVACVASFCKRSA